MQHWWLLKYLADKKQKLDQRKTGRKNRDSVFQFVSHWETKQRSRRGVSELRSEKVREKVMRWPPKKAF